MHKKTDKYLALWPCRNYSLLKKTAKQIRITNNFLIYSMTNYSLISSYIRKRFLIYDFAPAPF